MLEYEKLINQQGRFCLERHCAVFLNEQKKQIMLKIETTFNICQNISC